MLVQEILGNREKGEFEEEDLGEVFEEEMNDDIDSDYIFFFIII